MTIIVVKTSPQQYSGETNILIGGDYFPRLDTDTKDVVSSQLKQIISGASLATVNLEAPIQVEESNPQPKYGPTLALGSNDLETLLSTGFDMVNLANNHIMDYGEEGLRETIQYCDKIGLQYTGAGRTRDQALELNVIDTGGQRIGIINAGDKEFGVATSEKPGYAWMGDPILPEKITKASRKVDVLVLILHGGIEYEPIPAIQRQDLYRQFANAGADVILGHHPHVPQGWEVYDGTPICYSLGHFLFDFRQKYRKPKTEWGLLADIQLDGNSITNVILRPIEQQQSGPRVQFLSEKSDRLKYLQQSRAVINNREKFTSLWQALAIQRYEDYYQDRLDRSLITKSRTESDEHLRWLQNVSQCEAHRWCIQTATSVLGGTCRDERGGESHKRLEQLREYTQQSLLDRIKQQICAMV